MPVGVLLIHGVGRIKEDFGEKFQKNFLEHSNFAPSEVFFNSVCWEDIIRQEESRVERTTFGLGWGRLRKFFVDFGGDALGYQISSARVNFYGSVHRKIDKELGILRRRMGRVSPICVVAHSLGSVIMSDHLWDIQNPESIGLKHWTPGEGLWVTKSLKLFVTMGSPIAVWSLRYPQGGKPVRVSEDGKWLNLFCPNDIISYRVKPIGPYYKEADYIEDREVHVGGLLTSWNPLSHMGYWKSKSCAGAVAQEFEEIVKRTTVE